MFENLLNAAKSLADLADATVGTVVKPVKDGADFVTEGLREIVKDEDEQS